MQLDQARSSSFCTPTSTAKSVGRGSIANAICI